MVIEKVLKHFNLRPMLETWFGKDTGLLLDLASYFIINEGDTHRFADYAFCHPLFSEGTKIKPDLTISRFLNHITRDQIIGFLSDWNQNQDHRQRIYITNDAKNENDKATDIDFRRCMGFKDDNWPIFNTAVAFNRTNQVPLFFKQYPNLVSDNNLYGLLANKAKDYGYSHLGFILDKGGLSKESIQYLDEHNYAFLVKVDVYKSFVSQLIEQEKGTFETNYDCYLNNFQIYGKSIEHRIFGDDKKPGYFHLFFSAPLMAERRFKFERAIVKAERSLEQSRGHFLKLNTFLANYFNCEYDAQGILINYRKNKEAYKNHLKFCGYSCLISSEKMTALKAWDLYLGQDSSEKLYRSDKTLLGGRLMSVPSEDFLLAKGFIEFVALIIRSRMYNLLKEEMFSHESMKNFLTVPRAIQELEKIEMVRRAPKDYRLDHGVTKVQKQILHAFEMATEDVAKNSTKLAEILRNPASVETIEHEDEEDDFF